MQLLGGLVDACNVSARAVLGGDRKPQIRLDGHGHEEHWVVLSLVLKVFNTTECAGLKFALHFDGADGVHARHVRTDALLAGVEESHAIVRVERVAADRGLGNA